MSERQISFCDTHMTGRHCMFLAIATEASKHPGRRHDYKVWYLELNERKEVISIGVKTKDQLVKDLFDHYRKHGRSNWRAFCEGQEKSSPIELTDFIAQNMYENTHFGNLPTLAEFQETLDCLELNLELKATA